MPKIQLKAICRRLVQSIREDGFKLTDTRIKQKLHSKFRAKQVKKAWQSNRTASVQQENRAFDSGLLLRILVPVYNTPPNFLGDMLDSVQAQTCKRFELCLADGSDNNHACVGRAH